MLKYRKGRLVVVVLLAIGLAAAPALTAGAQAAVVQAPSVQVPAEAAVPTLAAVPALLPAGVFSYDMRFPIKSYPFASPAMFFFAAASSGSFP